MPLRRVRDGRSRTTWTLAALLPGVIATTLWVDPALPGRLLWALPVAVVVGAVAARLRGARALDAAHDPAPLLLAALVALMLPASTPWWGTVATVAIAVGVGRGVWGAPAAAPFHPAMLGAALAMLVLPSAPVAPVDSTWPAMAWATGGITLAALRVIRWPIPFAMLGTLGLAAAAAPGALDVSHAARLDPRVVLVAFFVATAPAGAASTPVGRGVFGMGIALALLGAEAAGRTEALPFAVLLMNALAPLIDRLTGPALPPRLPTPP